MKRVLVDTSIWISHFKKSDPSLIALLEEDAVMTHPFVLQELYLGRPKGKEEIFVFLSKLPALPIVSALDLFSFIDGQKLVGRGIGLVDTHLLASAFFAKTEIYSHDKYLNKIASTLLKSSK